MSSEIEEYKRQQSELRSKQVKAGIAKRIKEGKGFGRPNLNGRKRKKHNEIVAKYEKGETLRSIAKSLRVSSSHVHRVLIDYRENQDKK